MSEREESVSTGEVPPFIQIVTAASNAFGRGEDDFVMSEMLYGLDAAGRVWQWVFADPEREGSAEGWRLLPNTLHKEGAESTPKRKTR
jgi:hypothetical protein